MPTRVEITGTATYLAKGRLKNEIKSIIKEERMKHHLNKANDNPFGYNEETD